jgi:hypothetical protein
VESLARHALSSRQEKYLERARRLLVAGPAGPGPGSQPAGGGGGGGGGGEWETVDVGQAVPLDEPYFRRLAAGEVQVRRRTGRGGGIYMFCHVSHASCQAGRARRIFGRVRGALWRVYLPRLPIPAMAPKRSASTSPEPSTSSSEPSDSSSGGEQLPAQQTTRPGGEGVGEGLIG